MTRLPDVTPIEPADYPRVLVVWEASVRATHHFVTEKDIEFFRRMLGDRLPRLPNLVGSRDGRGEVIGFISVSGRNLDMLFVHPDWRGTGVGRRLLEYAVRSLHATTLDVNEQNEQALGFYRHMGFEVTGRSERDGTGKPYPILHMRLAQTLPGEEP